MPSGGRRLRVLIVSAVIPIQGSGAGCLTMYRHFVLRNDFEVAVATDRDDEVPGVNTLHIQEDRITARLRKTRFTRLVRNINYIRTWCFLPSSLRQFASDFAPDVIFSVVDDSHMGLAWQLSRAINVPLAVDFQDLFAVSNFIDMYSRPYSPVRDFLLRKYRFLNRSADVVFHVGEGMRDWFGAEARGELLYPMAGGGLRRAARGPHNGAEINCLRVLYTGNCRGAYGKMVLRVALESMKQPGLELKVYSLGTDMAERDREHLEKAGVYCGYLPYESLIGELEAADVFLIVMGFEDNETDFVATSFNTKWVDYVAFGKPIIVWAPRHSSAARFAAENSAACIVDQDDAVAVSDMMRLLMGSREHREQLAAGARMAAEGPLNPERLQELLKSSLYDAVGRASLGKAECGFA